MPYVVNDVFSGDGEVDIGDLQIRWVLVHVITRVNYTPVQPGAPDMQLRFGWFAFGENIAADGEPARTYWRDPVWINWTDFEWTPEPQYVAGGGDLTVWAQRFRYWLAPGNEARILVEAI